MKTRNKNIGNIEKEKLRLRVKQLELEKQIRKDWEELKIGFSISNLFTYKTAAHSVNGGKGFLAGAINHSISYFTKQVSEMASEKIESGLQKGIENLKKKLRTVINK